ncbi:hypothetical protein [Enterobacter kobei]|uniref:hypothetical protein n=1 Tax=Enterobacter kobei TaxID=208224 RepID=UPI002FD0A3D3
MSTITKQWLQHKIADMEAASDEIPFGLDEDDSNTLAALRIALASLEAEAVGTFRKVPCGYSPSFHEDAVQLYTAPPVQMLEIGNLEHFISFWKKVQAGQMKPGKNDIDHTVWFLEGLSNLTTPPAPVSVPDDVSWEDVPEEITEDDMALASAWAHGFNQCRAAMLQGAEPVTTAYKLRDAVETIRNSGIEIDAEKIFAERDALSASDCWCRTCRPVKISDMRFVVCPECGNKRCPHANDHRHACTGSNEPGQEGSAYPAAPRQEVK